MRIRNTGMTITNNTFKISTKNKKYLIFLFYTGMKMARGDRIFYIYTYRYTGITSKEKKKHFVVILNMKDYHEVDANQHLHDL